MRFHGRVSGATVPLAAALAVLANADAGLAQGVFTPTTSMGGGRALHAMTLLADGTVLAAGGRNPQLQFESLASAETYDPASATWTATGPMVHGREQVVATRLPDGRVLFSGGAGRTFINVGGQFQEGLGIHLSAEIYDPTTRSFSLLGDMVTRRFSHTATLLRDGRVLIVGGYFDPPAHTHIFNRSTAAEIFDPATGGFTPTGSLTIARAEHVAALLPDGRVLVVGGQLAGPGQAEVFDPATGAFTLLASLPSAERRSPGAVTLPDGRVVIAGGFATPSVDLFDPATSTFTAAGSLAADFGFGGVAALIHADGPKVLLVYAKGAQVFDPTGGAVVPRAGPTTVGELFLAGTSLADGRVLVAGGQDFVPFTFVSRAAAEVFTPNGTPAADAGPDQEVAAGAADCRATVSLDAAASTDPDGDALTYGWTGPFGTAEGASVSVQLGPGTHVVTLTVDDGKGATDTDDVTVTVLDQTPPSLTAPPPVTAQASGTACTATVDDTILGTAQASDACGAASVDRSGVPAGNVFPVGLTSILYTATDDAGNVATAPQTVTVTGGAPPEVRSLSASPRRLWPPRRQLVPVQVTVVTTAGCGGAVECRIVAVTSNEPHHRCRGGRHDHRDWRITGPLSVLLRAELGGRHGRIYMLIVECRRAIGPPTRHAVHVKVAPPWRRPGKPGRPGR
jgi:hypothetical protein